MALLHRSVRLRPVSTDIVASLLVIFRPLWLQLLCLLCVDRPHSPRGFASCQPLAHTAPALQQPRRRLTPRSSLLHCLSAFSLSRPSYVAASALADLTAFVASMLISLRPLWLQLLGSLPLLRPSCTAAFGHRSFAACQPSAYMAPARRKPRLRHGKDLHTLVTCSC